MEIFGKYRLERIVVAQNGVTVWDATDLHSGRRVQLSIFAHASSMLDHGRIEGGTFVVVDAPLDAPKLELVEISDEDAFFDEPPSPDLFDDAPAPPPPPRAGRGWLLATALLMGTLVGLGGLYVARTRRAPVSEVTITAAPIPVPKIEATLPTPPPPQPSATVAPAARSAPPTTPAPKKHATVRPAPRPTPQHVTKSDPLTL